MLTLVSARYLFPVVSEPIDDGAIVVEDQRIIAVGQAATLADQYRSARLMELGDALLLPAAVNAHTHLELTALEGAVPAGLEMAPWIVALIEARKTLNLAAFRASAEEGVRRMMAGGVAAVGEISTYGQSVAPVVESGLRGIIYLEVLNGDPAHADETLARARAQLAAWHDDYAGAQIRFGISLHAPYTVSSPLFERTSEWCRAEGIPLSIHAAESQAEVQWLLDRSGPIRDTLYASLGLRPDLETAPGVSPVRYLHERGALSPQTLLAHGVQVDDADLALMARSGAAVAHCPRSNTWLRNGRMPWRAYREAGVRLALGTDSLVSAPSLSVWDEAVYAREVHALAGEAPTAAEILRLATLGGADALGIADDLGSLAPGKLAALAFAPLVGATDAERNDAQSALAALMAGRLTVQSLTLP